MLEERVEEVLRRYEIEILRSYRVRGAYILETRQGTCLYRGYAGSEARAGYEAAIQRCLVERGFELVDQYLPDREGNYLGIDAMGEAHVVKRWFTGEECNLRSREDILLAAGRLAELHGVMRSLAPALTLEVRPRLPSLEEQQRRHLRELQRVRSYIRGKRDRNPLELLFLQCGDRIYAQGEEATGFLEGQHSGELEKAAEEAGDFFHGNYTYHNLILQREGLAVVQYDKSWTGIQLVDLYYLLRKTLEKNDWRPEAGAWVMGSYQQVRELTRQERQVLYGLLWFPDKFWKIANGYFNGKKSRIPGRNLVKLEEFLRQEEARNRFLRQAREELFS